VRQAGLSHVRPWDRTSGATAASLLFTAGYLLSPGTPAVIKNGCRAMPYRETTKLRIYPGSAAAMAAAAAAAQRPCALTRKLIMPTYPSPLPLPRSRLARWSTTHVSSAIAEESSARERESLHVLPRVFQLTCREHLLPRGCDFRLSLGIFIRYLSIRLSGARVRVRRSFSLWCIAFCFRSNARARCVICNLSFGREKTRALLRSWN